MVSGKILPDSERTLTVEVIVSPALLVVVRVVRPPKVLFPPEVLLPLEPPDVLLPAPVVELPPMPPTVELFDDPGRIPPVVELAEDGVPVEPAPATPKTVEVVLGPVAIRTVLVPEAVAVATTVVETPPDPDALEPPAARAGRL